LAPCKNLDFSVFVNKDLTRGDKAETAGELAGNDHHRQLDALILIIFSTPAH